MKVLRSIVALSFACLVLVSSTSFMIGIHRCGGDVKHISLFTEAEGCPMEQQLPPCHRALSTSCCQDVKVVHEQDDFSSLSAQVELSPVQVDDAVVPSVILAEVIPSTAPFTFPAYDPPIRTNDRVVVLQVFLI